MTKKKDASTALAVIPGTPKPRAPNPLFDWVVRVTGVDIKMKTNAGFVAKVANELKRADATPDQLDKFERWWKTQDWRGKQGQLPTPGQIIQLWGSARKWVENSSTPGAKFDYSLESFGRLFASKSAPAEGDNHGEY